MSPKLTKWRVPLTKRSIVQVVGRGCHSLKFGKLFETATHDTGHGLSPASALLVCVPAGFCLASGRVEQWGRACQVLYGEYVGGHHSCPGVATRVYCGDVSAWELTFCAEERMCTLPC
jgi:hypothetical protein